MSESVVDRERDDPNAPAKPATAPGGAVPFDVTATRSPVTFRRRQALNLDESVVKPGIARANVVADATHPDGSPEWADKHQSYTVLQQHTLFFDSDNDGIIYPRDTFRGCYQLGLNPVFSFLTAIFVHLIVSYPTRLAVSIVPDPWMGIYLEGMHNGKHGSDSGNFDKEGRFVPQSFEDMFSKWDADQDGSLEGREFLRMIKGNRGLADPIGWCAGYIEFGTAWVLLQKDGRIYKEDLRQVYEGSIFFRIRDARASPEGWNQGYGFSDMWRSLKAYFGTEEAESQEQKQE